ncbi:hypothetical protein LA080_014560 [Diaporthe eres]|nr:hypothetical protein LA080_014560 [Diaporthe eres]
MLSLVSALGGVLNAQYWSISYCVSLGRMNLAANARQASDHVAFQSMSGLGILPQHLVIFENINGWWSERWL